MGRYVRAMMVGGLMAALQAGLFAAAAQERQPPPPSSSQEDYGCVVEMTAPCQGRIDFDKGRNFEFTIPGPGNVLFLNRGNKRCTLEYSITESALAATGRQLSLGPRQTQMMTVRDAAGMTIRFFNRGLGSPVCDLTVSMQS
jgi:hypothetical protein